MLPEQPSYDTPLPVFVYGTLRTGQRNWRRLLRGYTTSERPAVAPHHVMFARGVPFVADGAGVVVGDVIVIQPDQYVAVLQTLDELEEFDPHSGEGWYVRVARTVLVNDEPVLAWIYHGSGATLRDFSAADQIADGDWIHSHHNERS